MAPPAGVDMKLHEWINGINKIWWLSFGGGLIERLKENKLQQYKNSVLF